MPDAASLLAAVAANSDDDLPRLVYADWLDEHDDPDRAEFLRLQCHSARVGPLDPTWAPAKLREFELFKVNETSWRPGKRDDASFMLMARWHRGFPKFVDLADVTVGRFTAGEWCNGGFHWTVNPGGLFDPWPAVGPVREVRFSGWPPGCGGVLHTEQLKTARSLGLMEWYAGVGRDRIENFAAELAHLPPDHFPDLTELDLDQGELNLHAVEALAAAPALGRLTGLRLRFPADTPFTDLRDWESAVSRLFTVASPRLETLAVEQLSPLLAARFARSRWPELRRLIITQRESVGLDAFAACDLPNLSSLHIALRSHTPGQMRTTTPIDALARWPALRTVERLSISGISDMMLKRFLASADLRSLRFLNVHVERHDTIPFQVAELWEHSCFHGLTALAGEFTNADLLALTNQDVLPDCHTVWSWDAAPPPVLRWKGGVRTVVPKDPPDAWRHNPTRRHWCGWGESLLG